MTSESESAGSRSLSPLLPRDQVAERTAVIACAKTEFQRVLQERQAACATRYQHYEAGIVAQSSAEYQRVLQERQDAAIAKYRTKK